MKISIICPVLNGEKYIQQMFDGFQNQDRFAYELIIMDGGSTDNTVNIIKQNLHLVDIWQSQKDGGQAIALNNGFQLATGDIYTWLNADESYVPNILSDIISIFEEQDLDFVYGDRLVIDENTKTEYIRKWPPLHPFAQIVYRGIPMPSEASFWCKELHFKTGQLNIIDYNHLCMDDDWFLRMAGFIKKWKKINHPIAKFVEHNDRKTLVAETSEDFTKMVSQLRRRGIEEYNISKLQWFLGAFIAACKSRYYERRLDLPNLDVFWRFYQTCFNVKHKA